MPSKNRQIGVTYQNVNRGFYHRGDPFSHEQKTEIVSAFFDLWLRDFPKRPSYSELARKVKASRSAVTRCIETFEEFGRISDPHEDRILQLQGNTKQDKVMNKLTAGEEMFLLSLHAEDPTRPNASYQMDLFEELGKYVSSTFIFHWFRHNFRFKGSFCKSSIIPKDKFKEDNVFRYFEYWMHMSIITDHTRFNFVDEKHFVKSEMINVRARCNPLTGVLDGIPASGNFRDAQSIIACMSVNPRKQDHIFYTMGKGTNNANCFMAFVQSMIENQFLIHGEVLILDNAAVHVGGSAAALEDLLWNQVVDGKALNILVLYLPTRSPELNSIELVFHVLVCRLKSFHYRRTAADNEKVEEQVDRVFYDMDLALFERCARHCGYNV